MLSRVFNCLGGGTKSLSINGAAKSQTVRPRLRGSGFLYGAGVRLVSGPECREYDYAFVDNRHGLMTKTGFMAMKRISALGYEVGLFTGMNGRGLVVRGNSRGVMNPMNASGLLGNEIREHAHNHPSQRQAIPSGGDLYFYRSDFMVVGKDGVTFIRQDELPPSNFMNQDYSESFVWGSSGAKLIADIHGLQGDDRNELCKLFDGQLKDSSFERQRDVLSIIGIHCNFVSWQRIAELLSK